MFEHQLGGDREAITQERRIDPAFEPLARIAGQAELLSGAGDVVRIEVRAFDQHFGGLGRDPRMRAAHDPADIVDHRIIGDHGHGRVKGVGLAVERFDLLAVLRPPRHKGSG